eukprot:TRINITY_DN9573_c0_g1_i1.p1 TRINITY_DN9573_c0_g1~~TRINITY_DN9573_c0_g1_i1.p1  ORF type:complete len:706 (-),score=214.91 TRINITY_DN9573_c0_g1_i1:550-2667(-)
MATRKPADDSKAKERADVEINLLSYLSEQIKHTIERTHTTAMKKTLDFTKQQVHKQVVAELKPLLKQELAGLVAEFAKELSDAAAATMLGMSAPGLARPRGRSTMKAGRASGLVDMAPVVEEDVVMERTRPKAHPNSAMRKEKRQNTNDAGPGAAVVVPMDRQVTPLVPKETTVVPEASAPLLPKESPVPVQVMLMSESSEQNAAATGADEGIHYQPLPGSQAQPQTGIRLASLDEEAVEDDFADSRTLTLDQRPEELVVKYMLEDDDSWHGRMLKSDYFAYFVFALIFTSASCIGLRSDYMSKNIGSEPPQLFAVIDFITFVGFLIEIVLRMWHHGASFWRFGNDDFMWNIFDTCLVASQGMEFVMDLLFSELVSTHAVRQLLAVRVVRLLRFLRLLRVLRSMQFFMELRIMCKLAVETTRSLTWAMALLGLVVYLAGVLLTDQITGHRGEDGGSVPEDVFEHFGTLDRTMLTLYQSITGGIIWGAPLLKLAAVVSPIVVPLFCGFIAFWSFAMANVVSSLCVEQALTISQEAHEDAMVEAVNSIFMRRGLTGGFTYMEFQALLDQHPEMHALFKAINVDSSESTLLFRLLDDNNDGFVDYEEFCNGAVRLRGNARSLELAMFVKDATNMFNSLSTKMKTMETNVTYLCTKHRLVVHQQEQKSVEAAAAADAAVPAEPVLLDMEPTAEESPAAATDTAAAPAPA